jgi:hypothetical protein
VRYFLLALLILLPSCSPVITSIKQEKIPYEVVTPPKSVDFSLVQRDILPYSVSLSVPGGRSSGTVIALKGIYYILTAGHCVNRVGELVEVTKTHRNASYLEDYRTCYKAVVLLISPPEDEKIPGLDLALLKIIPQMLYNNSSEISEKDLAILDEVIHSGNVYGEYTDSLLKGSITNHRVFPHLNNLPFYLSSLEVRGGCSGGGVYVLRNNKYVYAGMVTRGDGKGSTLIKPLYMIKKWLKDNDY